MAIHHDAYLFQPADFADAVQPYISDLARSSEAYVRLRSQVLRLFDENKQAREIAGEYGAWDKQGVMESTPEHEISHPQMIGFLLTFLIYHNILGPKSHLLGLRGKARLLKQSLTNAGWDSHESTIAVYGHNFRYFAERWIYKDNIMQQIPDYWNHIDPNSTGGRIGWLENTEVQSLHKKLVEYEDNLLNFTTEEDKEVIKRLYKSAREMYTAAMTDNVGLCLIVSG